jgi:4-hydroxy-3-methylbut-2-enyl diphosphate reductase
MDHLLPKVEIDPSAGFCSGVKRAIEATEQLLSQPDDVFCLGEIVHNEAEMQRLKNLGMKILNRENDNTWDIKGRIIIRAHGEPPSTFERLKAEGTTVVDATCPVVIRLQQRVKKASAEMMEACGSVIIFGKPGHPEVQGLLGNSSGNAIVIRAVEELDRIDLTRPLRVFSQTTSDLGAYNKFCEAVLAGAAKASGEKSDVIINQTVCSQMSRREPGIVQFALSHDVIVFVSGSGSSNGKYLSGISRARNSRTYVVTGTGQVKPEWFENALSIGVSGATSTPVWLMQQVAGEITRMIKND